MVDIFGVGDLKRRETWMNGREDVCTIYERKDTTSSEQAQSKEQAQSESICNPPDL